MMKTLRTSLVAAALLASTSLPSAALTNAEVLDAMNARIGELSQQITDLQAQIDAGGTPAEIEALTTEQQMLNVRRGQLRSLIRVVPRYDERFLQRIVTFYDLDVSAA